MKNNRFLTPVKIACLAGLMAGGTAVATSNRPNVPFIAVDDLRPELGCYGNALIQSPNIDRLAARGIVFQRAYCQQAVCSPSRTSVMTGARPDTTKVWDLETHFRAAMPEVVTLGQHFQRHGYFVQGMGKIYHGSLNDPPTWPVPWMKAEAPSYALPVNLERTRDPGEGKRAAKQGRASRAKPGPALESADVADETYRDGQVATMAVEALRELSRKPEPFFLAVGFSKPHLPFVAPKKYWDLYDPAKLPLAPNPHPPKGAPDYAVKPGGELRSYRDVPSSDIPDAFARQLKHGYYAAVSYMDAQLGRVLDELDRLGLRTNTIVLLWGDHGWKLGEHGAWCKHTNVELDINAPLILSVPGMKQAGRRSPRLVEFVDIYPTLCDLAGLPLPSHLEGTSFTPLLEDQRPWKTAAFSQYPRTVNRQPVMGYTLRTDRYRFTRWVVRDNPTQVLAVELYDHQAEPQENKNVADRPGNAALVKELAAKLDAGWQAARPR